jgi:hypothetical protein
MLARRNTGRLIGTALSAGKAACDHRDPSFRVSTEGLEAAHCWKMPRCGSIPSEIVSTGNLLGSISGTGSAEGERKSLHARTEKLDFELSIDDGFRLSDQLVETLFGQCTVA